MRWLAYVTLRVRGFTFEGRVPEAAKFVVVGAPHTSNWDFLVFLAALHHFRIRARYLGKHTLFRWPFGGLMRRLGGIPVRRDRPGSIARDVANEFDETDRMALVLAPEGTRQETTAWKSGFYRIALAADVPIVPAFVDLPNRRIVLGPPLALTGSPGDDMDRVRAFYEEAGASDERVRTISIHEEDAGGAA